jgi:hypothetical protein
MNKKRKVSKKRREYWKKYWSDPINKARRYEINRNWRKNHLERYRELARKSARNQRIKIKSKLFALLGNKCSNSNCLVPNGCTDIRCLQIDHIHGNGKQKKRSSNGHDSGSSYYRGILMEIKSGSKDYQLLCANCNWTKRFENNERGAGGRPRMSPEDWKNGKKTAKFK